MSDKSILVELVNENVISLTLLINSKTPAVAILLGFFCPNILLEHKEKIIKYNFHYDLVILYFEKYLIF